jgi:hypothetical protein
VPIALPNQPDGSTNVYRLTLCGSTGTPRHALLKNVVVKGAAQVLTATANASAHAANMQLYPNPTPDGRLTLALRNYRGPAQLTVCNALGQRVASATVPAGAASQLLDLSSLVPGLYRAQARTASGALVGLVRE